MRFLVKWSARQPYTNPTRPDGVMTNSFIHANCRGFVYVSLPYSVTFELDRYCMPYLVRGPKQLSFLGM